MRPTLLPMILSGGAGTRLWPLSREAAPKPFMPLPDGETLLGKTASRALALAGIDTLVTITNRDYYFHTKDTYAAMGLPIDATAMYVLEPFGRNTAPAVARRRPVRASARMGTARAARHAGRSSDSRSARVRRRRDTRGGARRDRHARDVRHHADASGNRLRLHRMRRHAGARRRGRAGRVSRAALRREAGARDGARVSRRQATTSGTRACSRSRPTRSSTRSRVTRRACSQRRAASPRRCRTPHLRRCSRSMPRCSPRYPTSRSTTR